MSKGKVPKPKTKPKPKPADRKLIKPVAIAPILLERKIMSLNLPVFCWSTPDGEMKVTLGGSPLRLQGFNYPPDVYYKNNGSDIDASITMSPDVYLGTVQAEHVIPYDDGTGKYIWIKQSVVPCDNANTTPAQVIVWYKYVNFHDTHWLIDEIRFDVPVCGVSAEAPECGV